MKRLSKLVAGVAIAGSLTAGAMGLGAGTASADPPPWAPGHGHDGGYGRGNDGQWNNNWNDDRRWDNNWNNNNNGRWNDNGPWGNRPPPPFWAPTADVFWDPTRQAWGFFWGPVWFPAY